MKNTFITLSVILILGIIWVTRSMNTTSPIQSTDAVRIESGIQYIHILARGGYSPRHVTAKANMPTILEIETKGTYDCSSAFTIPQMNYRKNLPATGITTIEIPSQSTVGTLTGLCSMGMYSFTIRFES